MMRPGAAQDRDAGVEAAGGSPCPLPPSPVPSFWQKKDCDCCLPPSEGHREAELAVTASLPPPAWRWVLSTQHHFCPGASLLQPGLMVQAGHGRIILQQWCRAPDSANACHGANFGLVLGAVKTTPPHTHTPRFLPLT